jgi:hypothetical protein
VTTGKNCVVIGHEYFPLGLGLRLAGNTCVCPDASSDSVHLRLFHKNALDNAYVLLLMLNAYRIAVGSWKTIPFTRKTYI